VQACDARKATPGATRSLAGGGIFQVLIASGCAAAAGGDLRDDTVGDRRIEAAAVLGHAGIVHDDGTATRGDESGIGGAQSPARARHDDGLAVETDRHRPIRA
jgi:hypothetical protein